MTGRARLALMGILVGAVAPIGASAHDPVQHSEGRPGSSLSAIGAQLHTRWIPEGRRQPLRNLDIAVRDHRGRTRALRDLLDRPTVVTFFYTRCQNAEKCSLAISQLAFLQRKLVQIGIDQQVRLIAITYEPQFDTPERMNRFATDRGLHLGEYALAIQLDQARQQQILDELLAPVNYNMGWVNTHGVQLTLLDAKARPVRKYVTLLWNNDEVALDLKRVLAGR